MAKLSAEQQAQLDELTALANAPDADDDEVWVKNPEGHATLLKGPRAAAWLKRHGYDADEGDKAADDADAKAAKSNGAKPPAGAKKAAPAKKTAPSRTKDVTDEGEEDDEGEEADPPPPGSSARRSFF